MIKKAVFAMIIIVMVAGSILNVSASRSTDISDDVVYGRCIEPFKPFLPFKPLWCQGKWTQILQCDQNCNCMWVPVCLQ